MWIEEAALKFKGIVRPALSGFTTSEETSAVGTACLDLLVDGDGFLFERVVARDLRGFFSMVYNINLTTSLQEILCVVVAEEQGK